MWLFPLGYLLSPAPLFYPSHVATSPKSCIVCHYQILFLCWAIKLSKPFLCLRSGCCAWVQFHLPASGLHRDIFSTWDISILKAIVVQRHLDVVNCCFQSSMSYSIHAQLPDCGGTSYLPWVKHKDKQLQSWRTNWFLSVWQLSNKQALWSFSGKVYNTNLYKTKKEKLPSPQFQYLLLYTGDCLSMMRRTFFSSSYQSSMETAADFPTEVAHFPL